MNGFPYLWFLFYTKIGRIILGIIIALMIITIAGWWLIPIILAIIAAFILQYGYDDIRNNKKLLKSAENRQKISAHQDQKKIEAYHQFLKDYPQAVGDVVFKDTKRIYDLYYLRIGKGEQGKDVFENKFFRIEFGIAKDYSGLVVSITNNSDKDLFVDWRSFVINLSRVHIDGVVYVKYPDDKPLAPHETSTKLLQSHKLYWGGKFKELFNTQEMKSNEVLYQVTFDIKDGDGEVRTFEFKLYALHKRFKLSNNVDEVTSYRNAIEKAKKKIWIGFSLIVVALIIALGIYYYKNRYHFYIADSPRIEYAAPEKTSDKQSDFKDTPSSTPITTSPNHHDNMHGFDPASEDDMHDNGMRKYMEANDEEAWD